MADTNDWLSELANQVKVDAHRAGDLRRILKVLSDSSSGATVSFSTDFAGSKDGYLADGDIAVTLKKMWPTIHENTMRRLANELDAIVTRYHPLLKEGKTDDK